MGELTTKRKMYKQNSLNEGKTDIFSKPANTKFPTRYTPKRGHASSNNTLICNAPTVTVRQMGDNQTMECLWGLWPDQFPQRQGLRRFAPIRTQQPHKCQLFLERTPPPRSNSPNTSRRTLLGRGSRRSHRFLGLGRRTLEGLMVKTKVFYCRARAFVAACPSYLSRIYSTIRWVPTVLALTLPE